MDQPYYEDENVVLFHGDCAEVLPNLGCFDLVFTSPPYNLGTNPNGQFGHWKDGDKRGGMGAWSKDDTSAVIDYGGDDDALPYDVYRDRQRAVLAMLWEHLTPTGAIFYNHKPRVQRDGLLLPTDLLPPAVTLRQIVTWDRGSGFNFTKTAYTPTSEWLMVLAPQEFRLSKAGAAGDVWRIAPDVGNEHPAPFPVSLPARAIDTVKPHTVLDPYAGSGSTLRAAKDAGVRAVGIEKSERFCELAVRRLAQEVLAL